MLKNLDENKLLKGIGTVILHFVLLLALQIPFVFLLKKKLISENLSILIVYLLLVPIFCLLYRKDLKNNIKDLKKNFKKIMGITIKYWALGFIVMFLSSIIINFLPINSNANQNANIELFQQAPWVEIIIACICSPIIEEIVYRLSFRKFTKNKWAYALTTGLIFASIHLFTSINSVKDLIMLIYIVPFGALGVSFGLAYHETDNIYGTMIIHALHNFVSILELLLIGGIML